MNKEAVQHERGPRNSTIRRQMALYMKESAAVAASLLTANVSSTHGLYNSIMPLATSHVFPPTNVLIPPTPVVPCTLSASSQSSTSLSTNNPYSSFITPHNPLPSSLSVNYSILGASSFETLYQQNLFLASLHQANSLASRCVSL